MKVSKKSVLTRKRLKKLLHYDPLTGVWTWKSYMGPRAIKGSRAGSISKETGYRKIKVEGKLYRSNRLSFLYMEGYFPEFDVDHKNRIRDDDKWSNLRHISRQCNLRNTGNRTNNTSGIKGVHLYKKLNKWQANICIDGKSKHLGYYKKFHNAILARLATEQCLNWNGCDSSTPAYLYAIKNNLIKGNI